MHHVGVVLHVEGLEDPHRAEGGDPADVVAGEVQKHHVLRDLLLVPKELLGKPFVLLLVLPPRPRARDGPGDHPSAVRAEEAFRARRDQDHLPQVQVAHVGARVHAPQRPVEGEGVDGEGEESLKERTTWKMSPARM